MDDIQIKQVAAGEAAVVERLRAKGLLPPEPPPVNWRRELADMYQRYTGAMGDAAYLCDDFEHADDCDCEGERIRALIEQPRP